MQTGYSPKLIRNIQEKYSSVTPGGWAPWVSLHVAIERAKMQIHHVRIVEKFDQLAETVVL